MHTITVIRDTLPRRFSTWIKWYDSITKDGFEPDDNGTFIIRESVNDSLENEFVVSGRELKDNVLKELLAIRPYTEDVHRIQLFLSSSFVIVPKALTNILVELRKISKLKP